MGGGTWTTSSFVDYSKSVGRYVSKTGIVDSSYTAQDLFVSHKLQPELNPKNVMRECRDTEEHPTTVPVILALDVTGSMGKSAAEVAKKLNEVMTNLYECVTDVEFLIMAIGDLAYDGAPIQASQFESDIRIAEQLDKVYFEGGGGGNNYESYTAAWYFGLHHTDLDCWKRGKKGILITIGDEPLNPYLPKGALQRVTGDSLQGDVDTKTLYAQASQKYDIYHLVITDGSGYRYFGNKLCESWESVIGKDHCHTAGVDGVAGKIVEIVTHAANETVGSTLHEISW